MDRSVPETRPLFVAPHVDAPSLGSEDKAALAADVVVVGAGMAGLSTAHRLAEAGAGVIVLDRGRIGGAMSQRTTGHLTCMLDDRYADLIKLRGAADAWLAAKSHGAAIDRIEHVQRAEAIDCDFRRVDGYLFLAPEHGSELLDSELAAAQAVGVGEVRRLERAPVTGFETGPCLHFARQGRMHAGKYLAGLAQAIVRRGGRLYTRARVVSVKGGAAPMVTTDSGHRIVAKSVVVATNVPINDRVTIHTKQAPYRTYVVAARVPKGSVTDALYWDTGDPYHYIRLQRDGDRDWLVVGGEDHKTGQAQDGVDRFAHLADWARARLPFVEPELHWSGQIMETVDYLCFAGRNPADPENVYIATGDSGMGMTHGTIAAAIISDLVLGHANPWTQLYDPGRITFRAGWKYLKENLNAAARYGGYATSGEIASADELGPGEGAVIRRGARKLAVYRDERGMLHEHSAVCPHLGCIVAWNPTARVWDCPCHGSQFSGDGTVINGPAVTSLEPAEERRRAG